MKQRLVLRYKPGGRCLCDVAAKAVFVKMRLQPGISVSSLAHEVGIDASQVSRWLRERGQCRKRAVTTRPVLSL